MVQQFIILSVKYKKGVRTMLHKQLIVLLLIIFTSSLFAVESGILGIQARINPLSLADLVSITQGPTTIRTPCEIGARFLVTRSLGLELNAGAVYNSGNEAGGVQTVGFYNLFTGLGVIYNVLVFEKSALGILLQYNSNLQQWNDVAHNPFSTGPAVKAVKYNVYIPSIFFGLEPSFTFDNHFTVFGSFGVAGVYIPSGKVIDTDALDYNYDAGILPLETLDNARFTITTDGIAAGLRYFF